ncbi:MAG: hydantoinase B/oxoprolinase family protein [Gammaproteobacteria bacterium]|nr:hydantoinase B/oxoprolinase family protein [Gammaproteobacteria bacterium]MBT8134817.1 hydantoinase B/oxoprolinase family protein [Gammaproteobacteria bacterium]NNJ48786.1 hydantoinase B/oxoprolinase family protein [Gammaproteobacteria bacterium]
MDAISLSIFANRIDAICSEMGATLQKAAFSPNIRDRLDYSCAIFDAEGKLCAQAAHIPVHLGSMAFAMSDVVSTIQWSDGDMVVLNDPYKGGTHLPDVTLIAPLYAGRKLSGFVANRAHHADIGSETPGSMPLSSSLFEEGLVIEPSFLVKAGVVDEDYFAGLMEHMRNRQESSGDFIAQVAANRRGLTRLAALIEKMGLQNYLLSLDLLNDYAAKLAKDSFSEIKDGAYSFQDLLDDDGHGHEDILIRAVVKFEKGAITVDFTGSAEQVAGNINCPLSVTAAAVYYVFRCLMPAQAPACAGSFRCINIRAAEGSVVNASFPAAVAAGNVETSTRIVDVVLGALAQAIPDSIPAASHGSMNNLAMGFQGDEHHMAWDYYETIGGGMGASATSDGLDAVQTHMTNTLNTPIESLEMKYPLRITRYQIRRDASGRGTYNGGEGLVREYEFLAPAQVTILSERRKHQPWGLAAGGNAKVGVNTLNNNIVSAKRSLDVKAGDVVCIKTPGGGGFG